MYAVFPLLPPLLPRSIQCAPLDRSLAPYIPAEHALYGCAWLFVGLALRLRVSGNVTLFAFGKDFILATHRAMQVLHWPWFPAHASRASTFNRIRNFALPPRDGNRNAFE
ncbi:hypothetical protein BJV78DRAFT_305207 [Lactifluus subvellereus]|nr:hypothetical protein BJV78DRAFT_305207 [Lactifluus subvellereus]